MGIARSLHWPDRRAGRTVIVVHDEQAARGIAFRQLHQSGRAFVVPNPWDRGTARLLAHIGFEALATTSAGQAAAAGHPDGESTAAETFEHVARIAAATGLPVTADLENGFGDAPESAAAAIEAAAAAGAVGASIEDLAQRSPGGALYDIDLATERIAAASEAARALPFTFTLTARCECFVAGRPDLSESIRRLQAYQEAGADVLYAPGLTTRADIEAVTSSVDRPVNVVMGLAGSPFTVDELSEMGVARISLGSTLSRVAFGAFLRAADEIVTSGSFTFAGDGVPYATLNAMLAR
jgi:2-methylisocitrate lyase-like PEP mutase family enzyme